MNFLSIRQMGELLRSGKISCRHLVDQTLADLRAGEKFNSFITFMPESAQDEAVELDRELIAGLDRGPLHGIPTAFKDLFYTEGIRTMAGSPLYSEFVPQFDADVVTSLREAGAVSFGKTNQHELAYGISSKNPHFGFVLNPRDPERVAGGSSGGSAALIAAGFIPYSMGTDTGGSIRIPAAFCGIVGLKPTYGRISRRGVIPLAFSLDHVGPLGGTVDDCAIVFGVLTDSEEPEARKNLDGLRIGVPENFYFDRVEEEVAEAVRKSIAEMKRLGAVVREVRVPDMDEANVAARIVQLSETAALYAAHTDPTQFGADVWALIQQGKSIAAHEYVNAQRIRTLFRRDFDELWRKIDVLATPTTPMTAPRIEEDTVTVRGEQEDMRIAATRLVRAINFLGEPALSMPCGTGANGMPIGLQLIAAPFADELLLQTAAVLERETGSFNRAPAAVE